MRNPRVHELREIFKAAVHELRTMEISMHMDTTLSGFQIRVYLTRCSMREIWNLAKISEHCLAPRGNMTTEHQRLTRVAYLAGINYYDTRKPGLKKRLMLEKLRCP